MKFGQLEINPAENPGVLDTGTWDVAAACEQVRAAKYDWTAAANAFRQGIAPPAADKIRLWSGSVSVTTNAVWFLASLQDGQDVFLRVGQAEADPDFAVAVGGTGDPPVPSGHWPDGTWRTLALGREDRKSSCASPVPSGGSPLGTGQWPVLPAGVLGQPLGEWRLSNEDWLGVFSTDAAVLDRYCRLLKPGKGPQALGATPRLGIGTRMTTQVWPGIFDAMARRGMATNAIQNSIRELSLLDDLLAARPPETNYSTGIGLIEAGWTGSTYEGLWVAGVLAALKSDHELRYGADADHVQVKRGAAGIERAKRVIHAARYYSFYTLDMADVLNYAALNESSTSQAEAFLVQKISDAGERRDVVEHHTQSFNIGGRNYRLDAAAVGRFVGKYWDTLNTVGELADYIASLKAGVAFDLELTIDEHPPEVAAFDCLTTDEEVLFLAREIQRRGLPITHLAPNFGQEKGHDYRCPDGLAGLERRARAQFEIASEFGLMLDVHSGDDLGRETRRVFGRATGGKLHFKVSPMLQLIYAELLQEFHPELFQRWWEDALAYARREAANGSPVARECLSELDSVPGARPSARHKVFHYYSFPFVGRRDAQGQFLQRAEFYRLSPAFGEAYRQRLSHWLGELADDVF